MSFWACTCLGDGSGVVARVFQPHAAEVEIAPVHEKTSRAFKLEQIRPGLFEGSTTEGQVGLCLRLDHHLDRRRKDPNARSLFLSAHPWRNGLVSFRPGQRTPHLRQSWARNCAPSTACPAPVSPFGRRPPSASAWWAISTIGMGVCTPCARSAPRGFGRFSFPGAAKGAHYKFEIKTAAGALALKTDPYGFFFETAPKNASIVWNNSKFHWDDEAWLEKRRAARPASAAR